MSISRAALRHLRQAISPSSTNTTSRYCARTISHTASPSAIYSSSISSSRCIAIRPVGRWSAPVSRNFSVSSTQRHGHLDPPKPGEEIHVTIVDQNGNKHDFEVAAGDNLLDIAQANDLEMEGACGGSCACSTCHVIVEDPDLYDRIPEADDDENDMLDLAFGLTETSRLGCQIKMSKELDGLVVKLPSATRNLQKSDFEKK